MSECLFCKIVAGEIPCKEVYNSESVLAFRDINPKAPVHVLVIPKEHIASFSALPARGDLLNDITVALQEISRQEGVAESGYRLIINNGADGGQEVDHLHWHLLGGKPIGPMVTT